MNRIARATILCGVLAALAVIPTLSPFGGSLLAAFVLLAALYVLRSLHRRSPS